MLGLLVSRVYEVAFGETPSGVRAIIRHRDDEGRPFEVPVSVSDVVFHGFAPARRASDTGWVADMGDGQEVAAFIQKGVLHICKHAHLSQGIGGGTACVTCGTDHIGRPASLGRGTD